MASTSGEPSQAAQDLLSLLRRNHNVLISGPPGTGKSRLLAEVASAFEHETAGPGYIRNARIPVPPSTSGPPPAYLPSPERTNREVFRTALHAGSKPRDFLRGIVPAVSGAGDVSGEHAGPSNTSLSFEVSEGFLYRASEHACLPDGAALLIVDEINRGPAVALFGPSIVALEPDKRLDRDGNRTPTSQPFPVLDDCAHEQEYFLPSHLYIVAAMNQVDTSVAALDVAFLRRFVPYRLDPDAAVLLAHFDITEAAAPAEAPASPSEVYALLVAAWSRVNERISLGRGPEYQIGHGPLILPEQVPDGLPESIAYAARAWSTVRQHVDEVFFGDTRGVGEVLAAGRSSSPYSIADTTFAGQPVVQLVGPPQLSGQQLIAALRAIAAG